MKPSFRFRIALLSFAVSGTLLTVFGIVFFTFTYQSGIDRMDREIRTLADSALHSSRPPGHWQNFNRSLSFIYGETGLSRIALLVVDRNGQVLFQSENTPRELAALPRPPLPQPAPLSTRGMREHALDRLDRDDDGKIAPAEFDGPPHVFPLIDTDRDGFLDPHEMERSGHLPPGRPVRREAPAPAGHSLFQTIDFSDTTWRVGQFSEPELSLTIALDMAAFYAEVNRYRTAFLVAVPLGLLLLAVTGWFLASRAMHPVALIARTAEGITARDLDRRIPPVGKDVELERLVRVSNSMLDRLEKGYRQAVRFSANAAHELQTPLTILQGELDNAIQGSEDGSDEQQRYSMLLEELRNLKSVVQKLLLLSHADEGRLNLHRQPVDLSELIQSAAEDIEIMAPELQVSTDIEQDLTLKADPALLNQIIRNMTANAAKYSEPDGTAVFRLEAAPGNTLRFTLSNTAPPIPQEDRPLLFERFHRVDKSRTAPGSGLGLSLAREIARAHGGDLILGDYHQGQVSFILTLPQAVPADPA